MRNLLDFFIKNSSWFIFVFYMILSSILLFNNNPFQQSIYLTSANSVCSSVYSGISNITSYFYLRDINDELQKQNAALEIEVVSLKNIIEELKKRGCNKNMICATDMEDAVKKADKFTQKGKSCLFSPAAASYNYYKNFEEKGKHYKSLIAELTK